MKHTYVIRVDEGDFDLDEDRSIQSSLEYALRQSGIVDAVVDVNEFNRAEATVETTATLPEVQKAFQDDDLNVEIDMKEESVMVHTGANTYKQDDFTTSVKKQKKFKYVPAKHGDNALVNNDKEVDESAFNELMNEYKNFVAESEHSKKKTEK